MVYLTNFIAYYTNHTKASLAFFTRSLISPSSGWLHNTEQPYGYGLYNDANGFNTIGAGLHDTPLISIVSSFYILTI